MHRNIVQICAVGLSGGGRLALRSWSHGQSHPAFKARSLIGVALGVITIRGPAKDDAGPSIIFWD